MIGAMRTELPSGTVTFLFTDVEGSTRLLEELGAEAYSGVLAEHHRVCREAWAAHGGVEVDTTGDGFFVAFARATDALSAAAVAQATLGGGRVRVRMGVHTGEVALVETGYVGLEVHRAARIAAAAHGGQVVVSAATRALVGDGFPLVDLGEHRFKDLSAPQRVFQLGDGTYPILKSLYRTNLPTPATPFLGREAELAAVAAMLRDITRDALGAPLEPTAAELSQIMSPRHFVDVRRTLGGPSPIETSRALEQAGSALDADRAWLTRTRAAVTAAEERLRARSLNL